MYKYILSYSGYDTYHTEYLMHEIKYSEDEFKAIVEKIIEELRPTIIEKEIKERKELYNFQMKDSNEKEDIDWFDRHYTKEQHIDHINREYKKERDIHFHMYYREIFNKLISDYGFSVLIFDVNVNFDEYYVIGKCPPGV